MSTTDQTQPTSPAALTLTAEALLDDAIGIQENAHGWLTSTQVSPHVNEATRAAGLEAATAIDITVEGLGWGTQALHRAADPNGPTWQRRAPEPLVTHNDEEPTPADPGQVEGSPATRAALSARAGFLAAELDDLGEEVANLTNATRRWLDSGAETRDAQANEHGQRADKNLTTSTVACCYANGQTETIADNLADTRTGAREVTRIIDEAESGLEDLRRHEATSTAHTHRAIDSDSGYIAMSRGDAGHGAGRGPVLEQEPPFYKRARLAGGRHGLRVGVLWLGWLVAWVPHRFLQLQANLSNLPPGWTSARRSQAHDACFLVHQTGRFPRTGLHPEPLAARQTAGAGRPRRGCRHRNGHQQPDGGPDLEEKRCEPSNDPPPTRHGRTRADCATSSTYP